MDRPPPPAVPPPPPPPGAPPPSTLPARIEHPSPTLEPGARPVSESRMLPPHQSKMERVTGHLAALSADLREWTELRVDLVKRQIEGVQAKIERFEHYVEAADLLVPAAVLGLTALFFLLVTIALGLGALIGSVWGGFAILTLLLVVAAGVFGWLGMRKVREAQAIAVEAKKRDEGDRVRDPAALRASQEASARNAAV